MTTAVAPASRQTAQRRTGGPCGLRTRVGLWRRSSRRCQTRRGSSRVSSSSNQLSGSRLLLLTARPMPQTRWRRSPKDQVKPDDDSGGDDHTKAECEQQPIIAAWIGCETRVEGPPRFAVIRGVATVRHPPPSDNARRSGHPPDPEGTLDHRSGELRLLVPPDRSPRCLDVDLSQRVRVAMQLRLFQFGRVEPISFGLDVFGKTEAAGQRGVGEEGDLVDLVAAQGEDHHAPGLGAQVAAEGRLAVGAGRAYL